MDLATRRVPPEPVQIIPDGEDNHWTLAGTLYRAAPADASPNAVILVHQLGSSQDEWAPLVERLRARRGITALTIDLRGHGQSVYGNGDRHITWESFGTSSEHWSGITHDVASAVRFLRGTMRTTSIVIVGSSIGASAALLAATSPQESVGDNVAGVVMLSPGVAYHGLDIRDAIARNAQSQRPILMLGGGLDPPTAEAMRELSPLAGPHSERVIFASSRAHGVALGAQDAARWDQIDAWIRGVLGVDSLAHPAAPTRDR